MLLNLLLYSLWYQVAKFCSLWKAGSFDDCVFQQPACVFLLSIHCCKVFKYLSAVFSICNFKIVYTCQWIQTRAGMVFEYLTFTILTRPYCIVASAADLLILHAGKWQVGNVSVFTYLSLLHVECILGVTKSITGTRLNISHLHMIKHDRYSCSTILLGSVKNERQSKQEVVPTVSGQSHCFVEYDDSQYKSCKLWFSIPCVTRWNSYYEATNKAIIAKQLVEWCVNSCWSATSFASTFLKEYAMVMTPLASILDILQGWLELRTGIRFTIPDCAEQ